MTEPTRDDLERMLAASPLRQHLKPKPPAPPRRPPLRLGTNHVSLLVLSGLCNGHAIGDGDDLHVMKAMYPKVEFTKEDATTENEDGSTERRIVYGEKPKPKIRALFQDGRLETYE